MLSLEQYHANAVTCHTCPARRCLTCSANGRHIDENAKAVDCPLGYFPAQEAHANRPQRLPENDWPTRGPALWADLHRTALAGNLTPEWLAAFRLRIGCGDCLRHWDAEVTAHPPDLGSAEATWEWTVRAHNSVNTRLGRPALTPEAARGIWGR